MRTELRCHRFDRVWDDAEFGPFFTRMNETDRATNWIDEVNGATIGDVNAETDSSPIGDDPVAICETLVRRDIHVDDGNFLPMDLLRGDKRRTPELMFGANFSVNRVEPGKRLGFVVRHFDARNAQRETVDDLRQRA